MLRSNILAHRGLFLNKDDMNSESALFRALETGFGLETDIRDLNTDLVISHDPPSANIKPLRLQTFFEMVAAAKTHARIALNIKSDGLSHMIKSLTHDSAILVKNIFFFDMSVPDTLSYCKNSLPIYSRMSEYEPYPAFFDEAEGVWIDNFSGSFPQVAHAKKLLEKYEHVTIVSPELHGRDHIPLWTTILESGIYSHPSLELCTDFPVEAAHFFSSH